MSEDQKNVLFVDKNIWINYQNLFEFNESRALIVEATEGFKTLNGVVTLIDFLEQHQFTKGEKLIAVGGGIIQDVAAYVSACYKRGIYWCYFPTTLLSMCDSCIGGKTGINYRNAKNQLGLFSAPSQVTINPFFLRTLGDRDVKSGLGEILKLSITGGNSFLRNYEKHIEAALSRDFSAYKSLIFGSLAVKKAIVEEDEFEFEHRRSLNYGHTLGHAIEVLSEYKIPHGHAVTIGMILVNELSSRRSLLSKEEHGHIERLAHNLLDPRMSKYLNALTSVGLGSLLKRDKKTLGTTTYFVVLNSIGDMAFLPLRLDLALLDEIIDLIHLKFYQ
jgi:3-dehydroquinate synthase